ncbi:MAG: TIGR04283 family arsenosugar biosynthesis glycosyltransferase [Hyphomonadaceae bacterium]|nr:TIGR04283 family arsenosugar biosynthesis glycosyltransferase [Hyphomonadaceae bacterium]
MPSKISVIIPTLNAEKDLFLCLESLLPGLSAGLLREVVLADGGSGDATWAIGEEAGCRMIASDMGRARQLRTGAGQARGDWLLFLHADTSLSPDWVERVAAHISERPGKAATFTLAYRSDASAARWLAARANRRTRWFGLPYGDQGLLISRQLYDAVGGYPDIALMEDVALVRALGKRRITLLSAQARTSAAKYERDGWRRRAYGNAWLLFRYLLGADPDRLAREYT